MTSIAERHERYLAEEKAKRENKEELAEFRRREAAAKRTAEVKLFFDMLMKKIDADAGKGPIGPYHSSTMNIFGINGAIAENDPDNKIYRNFKEWASGQGFAVTGRHEVRFDQQGDLVIELTYKTAK